MTTPTSSNDYLCRLIDQPCNKSMPLQRQRTNFLVLEEKHHCRRLLITLVLHVICVGCGDGRPPLYPVRGEVVFGSGEPVRHATVELVPATNGPSPRGKTDARGRFVLGTYELQDGAPAGEYRVVVLQVLPPRAAEQLSKLGAEHAEHGGKIPVISLKYASPETSELVVTVRPATKNDVRLVVDPR